MILALLILIFFQLMGEGTVRLLNLFIPGPVLGMVYFFIALLLFPQLKEKVESLSRFMNKHLALFFVPAGVGIIEYFDLFTKFGVAMVLTLVISTTITLAVTAWFFNILLHGKNKGQTHD
ncbi:CidA/LrgA family protein [Bdellovibrio reynosensis]|uniref:CidA/LrgA family protein n=1 Tax=Bdellovibrio reynosensis TaxID=2835041 RepID=A0ABY4C789_9BACT|nr:CidA/LrgA family protein [Bdellovibrio reynosensis]UOF00807.1 CidA/LrgA family protein [Bdellovibrio reynosensis]